MAGASRMSSVRGLNARPQIAKRFPRRSSPNSAVTFSTRRPLLRVVHFLDAAEERELHARSRAVWMMA